MATLRIEMRELPPREVEITSADVTIGRGVTNTLHFRDPWLSRNHATIFSRGNEFFVEDLESRNGTFLNGLPVRKSSKLSDGDVIALGDIRIVFGDRPSPDLLHIAELDHALPVGNTVILRSEEIRIDSYQDSLKNTSDLTEQGESRTSHLWTSLHKVSLGLISHFPLEKLTERVIGLIQEAIPAERGALLLQVSNSGPAAIHAKFGFKTDEELRISRTVADLVLQKGNAILTLDARSDRRFDSSDSILLQGIRSVMCVPVSASEGRVLGLIYLDSRRTSGVFSQESLRLLGLIANMTAIKVENCLLLEGQLEKRRMEEQLAIAGLIQRKLLPKSLPKIPNYEIEAGYRSCYEVGGDYYDFILKGGNVAIVVADISGKGVGAAIIMAVLQSSLRALSDAYEEPAELVEHLNRLLVESTPSNKFATVFYGILDPVNHSLRFVSCGHNPSLLVSQGQVLELSSTGPVLGLIAGARFRSRTIDLGPAAILLSYTDGITELRNGSEEEFGTGRLVDVVMSSKAESGKSLVGHIFNEMSEYSGSSRFDDDCTVVVVRREGNAQA